MLVYRARRKLNPDPLYVCTQVLARFGHLDPIINLKIDGTTNARTFTEDDVGDDVVEVTQRMFVLTHELLKMKAAVNTWEKHLERKLDDLNDAQGQLIETEERARVGKLRALSGAEPVRSAERTIDGEEQENDPAEQENGSGRSQRSGSAASSTVAKLELALANVVKSLRMSNEKFDSWKEAPALKEESVALKLLREKIEIQEEVVIDLYRRSDPGVKALGFLWEAYEPKFYYFEVIECVRRIALTGMLVFLKDGTIEQIVFGAFIALASLGLYGALAPYARSDVDETATNAQYMLFLQLFIAILINSGIAEAMMSYDTLSGVLLSSNLFVFLRELVMKGLGQGLTAVSQLFNDCVYKFLPGKWTALTGSLRGGARAHHGSKTGDAEAQADDMGPSTSNETGKRERGPEKQRSVMGLDHIFEDGNEDDGNEDDGDQNSIREALNRALQHGFVVQSDRNAVESALIRTLGDVNISIDDAIKMDTYSSAALDQGADNPMLSDGTLGGPSIREERDNPMHASPRFASRRLPAPGGSVAPPASNFSRAVAPRASVFSRAAAPRASMAPRPRPPLSAAVASSPPQPPPAAAAPSSPSGPPGDAAPRLKQREAHDIGSIGSEQDAATLDRAPTARRRSTSSAVESNSAGMSSGAADATAAAAPDPSERRLDHGQGPFLFREFVEHYGEQEAPRRWREATRAPAAPPASAGGATGGAVDNPIRAGRPAASSL